jgi:hypothetical protein
MSIQTVENSSQLSNVAQTVSGGLYHTAAETLLAKYAHTPCVGGAIQVQIEGKTYRGAALNLGRNPKTFSW